jgi:hypothetical protein
MSTRGRRASPEPSTLWARPCSSRPSSCAVTPMLVYLARLQSAPGVGSYQQLFA